MDLAVIAILFVELSELQFHYDLVIDSLYITATYRFRLYFFFHRDFTVSLFSPLFDLATPFLAILLYMAHPAAPPVSPPASPPQLAPSLSSDGDPLEIADSPSSSSSAPNDDYALADPGMANGFLSLESI